MLLALVVSVIVIAMAMQVIIMLLLMAVVCGLWWWLRNVARSGNFCRCDSNGYANFNAASYSFGVRTHFRLR